MREGGCVMDKNMTIIERIDQWLNENTQGYYNAVAVKKILLGCKNKIIVIDKLNDRTEKTEGGEVMNEEFEQWYHTEYKHYHNVEQSTKAAFLAGYDKGVTCGAEAQKRKDVEITSSKDLHMKVSESIVPEQHTIIDIIKIGARAAAKAIAEAIEKG